MPSKTALNLVINEIPPHYYRNLLISTVVVAVAILAFAKFAVLNRLQLVNDEWRSTDAVRAQILDYSEKNSAFNEVRDEYDMYFANNSAKGIVVNVMEVARIIDERLKPVAEVSTVSLMNNTLSVLLGGITLGDATSILLDLYDTEPLVKSVEIYTATSPEGEKTSVSMTIELRGGAE